MLVEMERGLAPQLSELVQLLQASPKCHLHTFSASPLQPHLPDVRKENVDPNAAKGEDSRLQSESVPLSSHMHHMQADTVQNALAALLALNRIA